MWKNAGSFFVLLGGLVAHLFILGCVSQTEFQQQLINVQKREPMARDISRTPKFALATLRSGQWVEYLIGNSNAEQWLYKLKILDAGDVPYSFWFEEELLSAEEKKVSRSLFILDEARAAVASRDEGLETNLGDYGIRLRQIVSINGSSAAELSNGGEANEKNSLPLLGVRMSFLAGSTVGKTRKVQVQAGRFAGCFHISAAVEMLSQQGKLVGCADSQVPLFGLVEAVDPLGRKWELLDFGFSGAESSLGSK